MAHVRHAVRMKPLPLPLRIAAGLAVTAAERARELPKNLVGLPVTVVSQVLQFSMRLQQQVTELAIKGDEALSSLRPVEETPSWATFDEDLPPAGETSAGNNGHRSATVLRDVSENARDPWEQEERALAEEHTEGEFDSGNGLESAPGSGEINGAETGGRGATAPRSGRADLRSVGEDIESTWNESGEAAVRTNSGGDVGAGTVSGGDVEAEKDSGREAEAGTDSGGDVEVGPTGSTAPASTAPSTEPGLGSTTPRPGGTEADGLGAAGPEGVGIEPEGIIGAAGLANYGELTLPQLRARLRRFTLEQLEELLAYERAHENRPSFVGMLSRRIGNVQRLSEGDSGTNTPRR
jgi:hypothetical protein